MKRSERSRGPAYMRSGVTEFARRLVQLAVAFCTVASFAGTAAAEWPDRPVKVLVGYPAGGANDLVARAVAARLAESLKQSFIVENRTGAAGAIAAEAVAKAPADGYTLYMISSAQILTPSVRKSVGFDPVKDFRPIYLCGLGPYFLLVNKDVPAKTAMELVALAKARPDGLNYASSGVGAGPHLTFSLFMAMAGIQMNHVPYRGDADALIDLVAGRVQAAFISIAASNPYVHSGELRALAVSSAERFPVAPKVPTVAESGYPGFDMVAWWGLVGPAKLPDDVVAKAALAVKPILESSAIATQFASLGVTPGKLGPEPFGRRIAADFASFADIVKRAGIVPQ